MIFMCAVVKRWIMLAAERFGSAGAAGLEHTMALVYDSAMMSKLFEGTWPIEFSVWRGLPEEVVGPAGSGLRHVLHSRFRVRVQHLDGKLMAPEAVVGHYTAQAVAEFELGALSITETQQLCILHEKAEKGGEKRFGGLIRLFSIRCVVICPSFPPPVPGMIDCAVDRLACLVSRDGLYTHIGE